MTSGRFVRTGLWNNTGFLKLWAGETISIFGSLVGRTALVFTAVLVLDASAIEIGMLTALDIVPGLLFGLIAGVWVDRLPRRAIMIVSDVGRAALLVTIPLAYALDALTMGQLFAVAFGTGLLTIFFDVAYQTYLPALVSKEHLVEGNSKMAASAAVAEVGGFSLAGFLVQLLKGPYAILVDSASFIWSAAFIWRIQTPEAAPKTAEEREGMLREIRDGGRALLGDPILRSIAGATVVMDFSIRMIGAVYLLYATRSLGFEPGVLGVVFAVGGVTSLIGALFAGRAARRFGIGRSMAGCLIVMGGAMLLTPAATDASVLALGFLIAHQFGDAFWTAYDINAMSLRQSITPQHVMGRVNAGMRFSGLAAALAGSLAGGVLGELAGLRLTLVIGASGFFIAAAWLLLSPVWSAKQPALASEAALA